MSIIKKIPLLPGIFRYELYIETYWMPLFNEQNKIWQRGTIVYLPWIGETQLSLKSGHFLSVPKPVRVLNQLWELL